MNRHVHQLKSRNLSLDPLQGANKNHLQSPSTNQRSLLYPKIISPLYPLTYPLTYPHYIPTISPLSPYYLPQNHRLVDEGNT